MSVKTVEKKRWYAIYTRPRWEKKVHALLTGKGLESYCPLNKVEKQWSDRKKIVEEPLFKSYVFVRVTEDERTRVRMTNGVVNFVYWLGKPAVVKERDIRTVKKFLDDYDEVEVRPIEGIVPGVRVVVDQGVMLGKKGVVKKVKKGIVEVQIDSIGFVIVASFEKKRLTVLHA